MAVPGTVRLLCIVLPAICAPCSASFATKRWRLNASRVRHHEGAHRLNLALAVPTASGLNVTPLEEISHDGPFADVPIASALLPKGRQSSQAFAATLVRQGHGQAVFKLHHRSAGAVFCGFPILFILAFIAAMMGFVAINTRSSTSSVAEVAAFVPITLLFVQHLSYTLVIPFSYDTSMAIGMGVGYSGFLIGIQMAGVCLGSVLMWLLFATYPSLWRRGRTLMLWAVLCNFVGAATYCALSVHIESEGHETGGNMTGIATILMLSRVLDGFGIGINVQFSLVSITHLFTDADRPAWMTQNQFAVMLGIGLGPLMASGICSLDLCNASTDHLAAGGVAYVGITLAAAAVVAFRYPASLEDVADYNAPQRLEGAANLNALQVGSLLTEKDLRNRRILLCGGLAMACLRGFVISGLEAATSLLLETEFGWDPKEIGVAIGVCFLFCIPIKALHMQLQPTLRHTSWIFLFAMLSVIGSLLLFSFACDLPVLDMLGCAYVLLLGDAVLFPALFMGDALTAGLLMQSQHLLPKGSWFDANHFLLYRNVLVAGIGRNIGPPLARIQVDMGGQDSYATLQVVGAGLFLVLLEVVVKPRVSASIGA